MQLCLFDISSLHRSFFIIITKPLVTDRLSIEKHNLTSADFSFTIIKRLEKFPNIFLMNILVIYTTCFMAVVSRLLKIYRSR